jgi:hypothetical protein
MNQGTKLVLLMKKTEVKNLVQVYLPLSWLGAETSTFRLQLRIRPKVPAPQHYFLLSLSTSPVIIPIPITITSFLLNGHRPKIYSRKTFKLAGNTKLMALNVVHELNRVWILLCAFLLCRLLCAFLFCAVILWAVVCVIQFCCSAYSSFVLPCTT